MLVDAELPFNLLVGLACFAATGEPQGAVVEILIADPKEVESPSAHAVAFCLQMRKSDRDLTL